MKIIKSLLEKLREEKFTGNVIRSIPIDNPIKDNIIIEQNFGVMPFCIEKLYGKWEVLVSNQTGEKGIFQINGYKPNEGQYVSYPVNWRVN